MVDEQAKVSVYVPYKASQVYVDAFIREKINWIEKCVANARQNQRIIEQKKFDHGGKFWFLGKKYPIHVKADNLKRAVIHFDGLGWTVRVPPDIEDERREEMIRDKLVKWYRQQAEEILGGRIFHYSRVIGVEPKKIAVRSQKRMWGCCDYTRQVIHLNWQIVLTPIRVIDYVVVHELCHLIHPNHSKRFWNKVGSVMPEYQEYRDWLRRNQTELMLPMART